MQVQNFIKKAKLSYILFEDNGTTKVGFNRYNSNGFIDDGSKWSDRDKDLFGEFVNNLEEFLDTCEAGIFTYEVNDSVGLENKLYEYGVMEMEQGW